MLGLGPDRKVLGIYFQRRLFLAGAHPPRPRHPCRLRPIEVGDRETVGARAPGAARHGDDGLTRMARLVIQSVIASHRARIGATRWLLAMTGESGLATWR